MFTIKLYRGHTMRLLQAESVEIFSAGPLEKTAPNPKDRTNDVREISLCGGPNGCEVFYLAKEGVKCWVSELQSQSLYNYAYVENDRGATTEKVYPY